MSNRISFLDYLLYLSDKSVTDLVTMVLCHLSFPFISCSFDGMFHIMKIVPIV